MGKISALSTRPMAQQSPWPCAMTQTLCCACWTPRICQGYSKSRTCTAGARYATLALAVEGIAFSPDGTHIAMAGYHDVLRLWDVSDLSSPLQSRSTGFGYMNKVTCRASCQPCASAGRKRNQETSYR